MSGLRNVRFTALFPFCGIGGGAIGFQAATAAFRGLGIEASFEVLGGIDYHASTARDFERLTGTRCLVADVAKLTPEELRSAFGESCPDVVFFSPPCKASSGLLSGKKAATPEYQAMAQLALAWLRVMFAAWPAGPKLILMENVPRITTRHASVMREARAILHRHGYATHDEAHDLGEVGGLGQHRKRLLMVGRATKRVPALLYQPTPKRVRTIGEVIGALPLPGDPAGGPLHRLPKISASTALRLALIPAGKDWRALPEAVMLPPELYDAVKGRDRTKGRTPFNDVYRVLSTDSSAPCVTGGATPSAGGLSIADPRPETQSFPRTYWVMALSDSSAVISGNSLPGGGPFSVADLRLTCKPRENSGAYGVRPMSRPSWTVVASACHDNGGWSVADGRSPASVPFPTIIAADGCIHRPMTALECAALQGLVVVKGGALVTITGRPFGLEGSLADARVKIGDAVPPPAAERVAEQMLMTLTNAAVGAFSLSSGGGVWVRERDADAQSARH